MSRKPSNQKTIGKGKSKKNDKKFLPTQRGQKPNRTSTAHTFVTKRMEGLVDVKMKSLALPVDGRIRVSDYDIPAPDYDSMMFSPSALTSVDQVYTFMLGGSANVQYTSGVINTYFPLDPSSTGLNFPEWSSLASLFAEFRVTRFEIQVLRLGLPSGTTLSSMLNIGSNLATAVAPGSKGTVAQCSDAIMYNIADTTATGYVHKVRMGRIGWSSTTTPTNTPYAGAPGCVQMFSGTLTPTGSGQGIEVQIKATYEFRSRS